MALGVTGSGYHEVRFRPDPRRDILWRTLCRAYFRHQVPSDGTVLELGAGYCQFINNIEARRRIALDIWPGIIDCAAPGVETVVGDATGVDQFDDHSIDYVFASNLFEHMPHESFASILSVLTRKLTQRGILTILQPNYRYAYREYFDDYTHVAIYSHVSLADFLVANRFEIDSVRPRFLPLTLKSRLPVSPFLIRAYLRSPVKPFGKQMLISSRPRREPRPA